MPDIFLIPQIVQVTTFVNHFSIVLIHREKRVPKVLDMIHEFVVVQVYQQVIPVTQLLAKMGQVSFKRIQEMHNIFTIVSNDQLMFQVEKFL